MRPEHFGIKFTGERLTHEIIEPNPLQMLDFCLGHSRIPFDSLWEIRAQHLARYNFIARTGLVENRNVLEIACGSGYGTKILKKIGRASSVTGIDLSHFATEGAANFYRPYASFSTGNAERCPFCSNCFEVVTLLEAIEHVENDMRALKEITRVLVPRGLLIVSTPNRHFTNPGASINDLPKNSFHKREYTGSEFLHLLSDYFDEVEMYGQDFRDAPASVNSRKSCGSDRSSQNNLASGLHVMKYRLSRLLDVEERSRVMQFVDTGSKEPMYFVAVCRKPKK